MNNNFLLFTLPIPIAILVFINYCGIGFTYDSELYIDIAQQMSESGTFSAKGLHIKPPVYPFIIYCFGVDSLPVFNIICFSFSYIILYLFGSDIKNKTIQYFYYGILIFATPYYTVHAFAWTEPLFISIMLLSFYLLYTYFKSYKTLYLLGGLVLLFVLPFIRFAGVFVVAPMFLLLFIQLPSKPKKILFIVFIIGSVLALFWVLRFSDGFHQRWKTFMYPINGGYTTTYTMNLVSYLEAVSQWFIPYGINKAIRIGFTAPVLIGLFLMATKVFSKKAPLLINGIPFIFLIYYVLLHFVFGIPYYAAERYLTPFYGLLLLSVCFWIDSRYGYWVKNKKTIVCTLLTLLLIYNTVRTVKNAIFWKENRCKTIEAKL